jgi:hypothetical protein
VVRDRGERQAGVWARSQTHSSSVRLSAASIVQRVGSASTRKRATAPARLVSSPLSWATSPAS